MIRFAVGIDPGVKTGIGVWDRQKKRLTVVGSGSVVEIMGYVLDMTKKLDVELFIEDARKRTWFGPKKSEEEERAKLQGAGSVKRDCAIWEEFCNHYEIPYTMVHPKDSLTKWDKERFQLCTGWKKKSNEHGRDAALLVYQR